MSTPSPMSTQRRQLREKTRKRRMRRWAAMSPHLRWILVSTAAASALPLLLLIGPKCSVVRYALLEARMAALDARAYPPPEGLSPPNFNFPSPEERVEYYMGKWFNRTGYGRSEPGEGGNDMTTTTACGEIPLAVPSYFRGGLGWDTPLICDAASLRRMRVRKMLRGEVTATYEEDVLHYFYGGGGGSGGDSGDDEDDAGGRPIADRRVIFEFGDFEDHRAVVTKHPAVVKSRYARSELGSPDTESYPIIALLNVGRHYSKVDSVRQYHPWETKRDAVLWRGATTGNRAEVMRPFLDSPSEDFDFAFVVVTKDEKNTSGGTLRKSGKWCTSEQMMRCKYLLALPGNDVSTGLKWMLYSDSVVVMPRPRKVTWAMEEFLVPYVHYLPVEEDLSDLRERLEWAREHDDLCRNISMHATHFMQRIYASPRAKRDNEWISSQIARRYERLYGDALAKC
mmetsp:Transcript_31424/g.94011  ORF Transcript_31424/g.94011 Transcript_31424/m.94011 type:complete len:454 (-) Transcript_31424:285-1646(-)